MPTKHDKILIDCLEKHFNSHYHSSDIILKNQHYTLDKLILTDEEFRKYTPRKEKDKFKYKNGLYYYYNFEGELDFGLVSLVNKYAILAEVKSSDKQSNYEKAYFQLLKDKEYVKEEYDIDRCFGFYVTNDLIERVL